MQQCTGYVCRWRHTEGGYCAHVTTLSEHDLHLFAATDVARPHLDRPQLLRLSGVLIGHWLVVTGIEPAGCAA